MAAAADETATTVTPKEGDVLGLDLQQINAAGMGAGLYMLMQAVRFATDKKMVVRIIQDRFWPLLNGVPNTQAAPAGLVKGPASLIDNSDTKAEKKSGDSQQKKKNKKKARKAAEKEKKQIITKSKKKKESSSDDDSELEEEKSGPIKPSVEAEDAYQAQLDEIDDSTIPKILEFATYFTSFPTVTTKTCKLIIEKWASLAPAAETGTPKIQRFANIIQQDVFLMRPEIEAQVQRRILKSGFNPETDILLHIRGTDKVKAYPGSWIEAGALDLEVYVQETLEVLKTQPEDITTRVFLCSCDQQIREAIPKLFKDAGSNVEVVYDKSESPRAMHALKHVAGLTLKETHDENITALKILVLMQRARVLIGARASYLFRIGELLRYPAKSINIKDSEVFGIADYAETTERFVRPTPLRAMTRFIADRSDKEWATYKSVLDTTGIVSIPNILVSETAEELRKKYEEMPQNWFSHAVRPNAKNEVSHIDDEKELPEVLKYAHAARDAGHFSYHFERTFGAHYKTCKCAVCVIGDSMGHYKTWILLGKLFGVPSIYSLGETFGSCYRRGQFLSRHHDSIKVKHMTTSYFLFVNKLISICV
jgi:hypothetical protein